MFLFHSQVFLYRFKEESLPSHPYVCVYGRIKNKSEKFIDLTYFAFIQASAKTPGKQTMEEKVQALLVVSPPQLIPKQFLMKPK